MSPEMYEVLKAIPSYPEHIGLGAIRKQVGIELTALSRKLTEAKKLKYIENISELGIKQENYNFEEVCLTELGSDEIKKYEDILESQRIAAENLEISRNNLKVAQINEKVSRYAMIGTVAAAIIALIQLLIA